MRYNDLLNAKEPVTLKKVAADDFPALPPVAEPVQPAPELLKKPEPALPEEEEMSLDETFADLPEPQVIPEQTPLFDAKQPVGAKPAVDPKKGRLDAKFDAKPKNLDAKLPSRGLTPNVDRGPNKDLTPNSQLAPSKTPFPSWDIPRLFVRIPRELQDRMRFIGLSKGLNLQETVLLAVHGFLASEGLALSADLASNAIWRRTDQMIDDAVGTSTSSNLARPEQLLDYYRKCSGNPVKEGDWKSLRQALSYTPLAVKAGILMSILRKELAGGRVNSFKYCLGAIDEVAKSGVVDKEEYIRHLEMKLERSRAGKS